MMPAATRANFISLSLRSDYLSIQLVGMCVCYALPSCFTHTHTHRHKAHGCHNPSNDAGRGITAAVLCPSQTSQKEQQPTTLRRHQHVFTHTCECSPLPLYSRSSRLIFQEKGNVTTSSRQLLNAWQAYPITHTQTHTWHTFLCETINKHSWSNDVCAVIICES